MSGSSDYFSQCLPVGLLHSHRSARNRMNKISSSEHKLALLTVKYSLCAVEVTNGVMTAPDSPRSSAYSHLWTLEQLD